MVELPLDDGERPVALVAREMRGAQNVDVVALMDRERRGGIWLRSRKDQWAHQNGLQQWGLWRGCEPSRQWPSTHEGRATSGGRVAHCACAASRQEGVMPHPCERVLVVD